MQRDGKKQVGRPVGPACEYCQGGDPAYRCRKSARAKVTQDISGSTHVTYRCWKHYVRLENMMRSARKGMGNVIDAEEV